jgi:small subunit ribosomal protein S7
MRRKVTNRNIVGPDMTYDSVKVSKLINQIMQEGKKNTARKIVYGALNEIKEKAKVENPMEIFELAIKNTSPVMEVRSRRVGGANYQVPIEVRPERRLALSIRWIIDAAQSKKGSPMHKKLATELLAASNNEGDAIKKKENVHKMAEANKAFAHFAWN